jgi:hypothetical protein
MSPDPIVRAAEYIEELHVLAAEGLIVLTGDGPIKFQQPDNERVKAWQKCRGTMSQDTIDRGWLLFCVGQECRKVFAAEGSDSDRFNRLCSLAFSIEEMPASRVKECLSFYLDQDSGKAVH